MGTIIARNQLRQDGLFLALWGSVGVCRFVGCGRCMGVGAFMLGVCGRMRRFITHQGLGRANPDDSYQCYNSNTCQHTLHGRTLVLVGR